MTNDQRFFLPVFCFAFFLTVGDADAGLPEKVEIGDGKIALELPDGWRETELNAGEVLAGFASNDNRSSAFFREMDAGLGGSMQQLLDATIANFEQTFEMRKVDESKTGQVNGPDKKWPAIFTTAEGFYKDEEKEFGMKFYILIFDTGTGLYFLQASTTLPMRDAHERMIYDLIRSIVAKP